MGGFNNKAQQSSVGISFGMIFAIFLIIIFIIIAFVAIKAFLGWGESVGYGQFYQDFQEKINTARSSQSSETTFKVNLPSEIERVCFINYTAPNLDRSDSDYKLIRRYKAYDANVVMVPPDNAESFASKKLKGIDIEKTTHNKNPYCVENSDELTIIKDFYSSRVVIR